MQRSTESEVVLHKPEVKKCTGSSDFHYSILSDLDSILRNMDEMKTVLTTIYSIFFFIRLNSRESPMSLKKLHHFTVEQYSRNDNCS